MRANSYLKLALGITGLLIGVSIFSKLFPEGERAGFISPPGSTRINPQRIKELIQENKLSDKEAMFYQLLEQ